MIRLHRVSALLVRHLYLYKRSVPRIMDVIYWPFMDLLLWGFLTVYLQKAGLETVNVVAVVLGALILWELLQRAQGGISIAFLEEVWERNLLNIFVTPLTVWEFLASTFSLAFVRIVIIGTIMSMLAWLFYRFNILSFGLSLVPLLLSILVFGWAIGLLTTSIIMRFGSSAQVLAFGFVFIIQPFSAVFYPVSALPPFVQPIAWALPSSHAFEGMRTIISGGTFPMGHLAAAFGLDILYLLLACVLFLRMFAYAKNQGSLSKLE